MDPRLLKAYLLLTGTAALWGGSFVIGKLVGVELPPFTATALRFLLSAAVLFTLCVLQGENLRPDRRHLVMMALMGVFGLAAYNLFFFSGLRISPASVGALVVATNPVITVLLGRLWFGELLTGRSLVGAVLAFAGVAVLVSAGAGGGAGAGPSIAAASGGAPVPAASGLEATGRAMGTMGAAAGAAGMPPAWLGPLLFLGSAVVWSLYSHAGKRVMRSSSPLAVTAYTSAFAMVGAAVGSWALERPASLLAALSVGTWLGLAYLGVLGSGIALVWWNLGVKTIGAGRTSLFLNLEPVSGVALAAIVLGERPSALQALGAALVIGGVWFANSRAGSPGASEPAQPGGPVERVGPAKRSRSAEPADRRQPSERGAPGQPGVLSFLGLGSNLGAREATLRAILRRLGELPGTKVEAVSSLYETAPWGGVEQPPFLNAVVAVRTRLAPLDLLKACLCIETELGRVRGQVRWGPRTADIDLLLYGDQAIDSPELTVPHPRLTQRAFVLVPLAELAPDRVVNGRTVREWLAALPAGDPHQQVTRVGQLE